MNTTPATSLPLAFSPDKAPAEARASLPLNKVVCADCVEAMRLLPNACADAVVTSPPYFQQRNYGGEGIGNESSVEDYLRALAEGFAEVVRVVKPTGNIIYNLGDKYLNGGLLLVPFRFAVESCQRFPVSLVNNITWVKSNPTPRQYKRRLVSATEPFFHFVKGADYYYNRDEFHGGNGEAISSSKRRRPPEKAPTSKMGEKYRQLLAESPLTEAQKRKALTALDNAVEEVRRGDIHSFRMKINGMHVPAFGGQDGGRNNQMRREGFTIIRLLGEPMKSDVVRDVLECAVQSGNGSGHPAIFPTRIIRELVRMLCPPGGVVLDPYAGSGVTLVAAKLERRNFIGMDINPEYCKYARAWTAKI